MRSLNDNSLKINQRKKDRMEFFGSDEGGRRSIERVLANVCGVGVRIFRRIKTLEALRISVVWSANSGRSLSLGEKV